MTTWVGIPTRGDRDLRPLLTALQGQDADRVLVVCNRPSAPAALRAACASVGALLICEPITGYASARNRLLVEARAHPAGPTLLAMIDDDEIPEPGWLACLLTQQRRASAAAVLGPVLTHYPRGTRRAVRRADLPRRPRHRDGAVVSEGITGNCLLHLRSLDGLNFDTAFDADGSEDAHFFRAVRQSGGSLVWADGAVVVEEATPDRLSASALCARSRRNGAAAAASTSQSRAAVLLSNRRRLPKAVLLLAGGLVLLRSDLLLRAAWEVSFLAGVAQPTVRRAATSEHPARGGRRPSPVEAGAPSADQAGAGGPLRPIAGS